MYETNIIFYAGWIRLFPLPRRRERWRRGRQPPCPTPSPRNNMVSRTRPRPCRTACPTDATTGRAAPAKGALPWRPPWTYPWRRRTGRARQQNPARGRFARRDGKWFSMRGRAAGQCVSSLYPQGGEWASPPFARPAWPVASRCAATSDNQRILQEMVSFHV